MADSRNYSLFDRIITEGDKVLRTLSTGNKASGQPSPSLQAQGDDALSAEECLQAARLMRINHTGEVCAQALYQGQSLTAKLPDVRHEMQQAAKEESDHLNWCQQRLQQLDSRPSLLNPLFYGLSFSMGAVAGAISDEVSLGFVAATEENVCHHLQSHLQKLPANDHKSRAVIEQMLEDEARHQQTAIDAGGAEFPMPVKAGMKLLSKVMTKTTYYI